MVLVAQTLLVTDVGLFAATDDYPRVSVVHVSDPAWPERFFSLKELRQIRDMTED